MVSCMSALVNLCKSALVILVCGSGPSRSGPDGPERELAKGWLLAGSPFALGLTACPAPGLLSLGGETSGKLRVRPNKELPYSVAAARAVSSCLRPIKELPRSEEAGSLGARPGSTSLLPAVMPGARAPSPLLVLVAVRPRPPVREGSDSK